jgi:hypothetical protein
MNFRTIMKNNRIILHSTETFAQSSRYPNKCWTPRCKILATDSQRQKYGTVENAQHLHCVLPRMPVQHYFL